MLQHPVIHLLEVRCLFFNSFRTVVGLTCNTRAVSRMPLAFMAISTICRLTSGDCPAYAYAKRNVRPRVRACPASIPLLPFWCGAMSHDIYALAVGTMHYLRNHRCSLSHLWFYSALTPTEDSASTALKHLPKKHLPHASSSWGRGWKELPAWDDTHSIVGGRGSFNLPYGVRAKLANPSPLPYVASDWGLAYASHWYA